MSASSTAIQQGDDHIALIPVALEEAALDSPTFRSSFQHITEQTELLEKWLFAYYRSTHRFTHEMAPFEPVINSYLQQAPAPTFLSEAILDHDYTLLAIKLYGESTKEFWSTTFKSMRRMESNIIQPIKAFLHHELQTFKESRRSVEAAQRHVDGLQARYSALSRSKEPSVLREEAHHLFEARKVYLKASLEFSALVPELRISLDKLLVRIFSTQCRDQRNPTPENADQVVQQTNDIERIRAWSEEMQSGEKKRFRDLNTARIDIEKKAQELSRPPRDLDAYAIETTNKYSALSATTPLVTGNTARPVRSEKQGWLNLRTLTGKPTKTAWIRRWFFVKNGIFGWLVQGSRSGAVEESEKIGVLLCSIRVIESEDRRYVFEIKTKDCTIVLQAETQLELNDWLMTFDYSRRQALDNPMSSSVEGATLRQDPAFSITPPTAPEFSASAIDAGLAVTSTDDLTSGLLVERSSTLPPPTKESGLRMSSDASLSRRALGGDNDSPRDSASKIMSKLDLHRKSNATSSAGGVASLIAASHGSLPVGPGAVPLPPALEINAAMRRVTTSLAIIRDLPSNSLAPNTLAIAPVPTNLSAAAIIIAAEQIEGSSLYNAVSGTPSGLLANVWGSRNWCSLTRLERTSPWSNSTHSRPAGAARGPPHHNASQEHSEQSSQISPPSSPALRRKANSLGASDSQTQSSAIWQAFPQNYSTHLKTQDAQFRLLFSEAVTSERVVLVFTASWNPNEQQEFPGRVYVTSKDVFFYSNYAGMTMTTSVSLESIEEVTAGGGKDWDVVFLHLRKEYKTTKLTRVSIKTFLEPLKLLKRRLSYLVRNASNQMAGIEEILQTLTSMEHEEADGSPSERSWENVDIDSPMRGEDGDHGLERPELRTKVVTDRGLYGNAETGSSTRAFKFPKQPIVFRPSGMDEVAVEKDIQLSAKSLFHLLFGDRSAVWQLLYNERGAKGIRQGAWRRSETGQLCRNFDYDARYLNFLRQAKWAHVQDKQVIELATEHLLYGMSDRKIPWHLPYHNCFTLLSKVIITFVSKTRSRLAIYSKIEWHTDVLPFGHGLVQEAALQDMQLDALDLMDVVSEQVRRLHESRNSSARKVIATFGLVGPSALTSSVNDNSSGTSRDLLDTTLTFKAREARRPRSLARLSAQAFGSLAETIAAGLLQVIGNCVRWSWRTLTFHRVIIGFLLLSTALNMFFTSHGLLQWQTDRRVQHFLTALSPSKPAYTSIHLDASEIELALSLAPFPHPTATTLAHSGAEANPAPPFIWRKSGSMTNKTTINACEATYRRLRTDSRAGQSRFHGQQARLGQRRYELMLALRLLGTLERETVRADWQAWLAHEAGMCRVLDNALESKTAGGGQEAEQGMKIGRVELGKRISEGHCRSCLALVAVDREE